LSCAESCICVSQSHNMSWTIATHLSNPSARVCVHALGSLMCEHPLFWTCCCPVTLDQPIRTSLEALTCWRHKRHGRCCCVTSLRRVRSGYVDPMCILRDGLTRYTTWRGLDRILCRFTMT
jgi:hypothetical protein